MREDVAGAKVMVFAAHPDDEVLGLGLTLISHREKEENVVVVFTTNGSRQKWSDTRNAKKRYASQRYDEACSALGIIGIPPQNIISLGFPDAGLRRYMPEAAKDIESLIQHFQPEIIYVHALEGGHRDHDVTSFLVQCIGARLAIERVYEWAEYSREALGSKREVDLRFPFDPHVREFRIWSVVHADKQCRVKLEMLEKYVSQAYITRRFSIREEKLREANSNYLVERLGYFAELSKARLRYLRAYEISKH